MPATVLSKSNDANRPTGPLPSAAKRCIRRSISQLFFPATLWNKGLSSLRQGIAPGTPNATDVLWMEQKPTSNAPMCITRRNFYVRREDYRDQLRVFQKF